MKPILLMLISIVLMVAFLINAHSDKLEMDNLDSYVNSCMKNCFNFKSESECKHYCQIEFYSRISDAVYK